MECISVHVLAGFRAHVYVGMFVGHASSHDALVRRPHASASEVLNKPQSSHTISCIAMSHLRIYTEYDSLE